MTKISIIGLGYVGLPLALQFARSGLKVLGLDVDPTKVDAINTGRSYIKHINTECIQKQRANGHLEASTDFSRIKEVEAVLICVPTPLNKNREPNLTFVLDTGRAIATHLQKGALVVLESTTYPGTTDTDLRAVLEVGSGLKAGEDFYLAYSPEREDPGNPDFQLAEVPKVIGGLTADCLEKARCLYSEALEETILVSSCRVAEASKLLENIFRSVNIALVNELKMIFHKMGIDIWDVIEAAATKPFGFMPFYPGPGLGGHCVPIDPFYLSWKALEVGLRTRFIELAGEINTTMPEYVVGRITDCLNEKQKAVRGSRVLIIGLAYKPNIEDERESPSYALMDLLTSAGAKVSFFDTYVPVIPLTRQHAQWAGQSSIKWNEETVAGFDVVLIVTDHENINYVELGDWAQRIVDTRNVMASVPAAAPKVWKA